MARKTLVAIGIGMVLPFTAEALTLSQIKVGSLLNQPLKAVIEVTADSPEELDSLSVNLAPASQFAEKGVPRTAELDKLRFQVVRKDPRNALVVVSTGQPVKEPFLDFLVDARWGTGQVVREYTLLLDPPFTTNRPPPALDIPVQAEAPATVEAKPVEPPAPQPVAAAPEKAPEPEKMPEKAPEKTAEAVPAPAPPARAAAPAPVTRSGDGIEVNEGNTLWSIAKSVRPSGSTVYQTLEAIYRANPEAFLQNNVNLMLKGAILRVPPAEEIRALDSKASERLLAEHTQAWRPGTPVSVGTEDTQTSAAGGGSTAPADTTTASQGGEREAAGDVDTTPDQVRLASAGAGETGGGEGSDAEAAAAVTADLEQAQKDALLAREEAESAKQETVELRERLVAMQEQLEDSRRLLELKDEQLARLQAYYAQLEEQAVAPPEGAPETESAMAESTAEPPTSAEEAEQAAPETEAMAPAAMEPAAEGEAEEAAPEAGISTETSAVEETVSEPAAPAEEQIPVAEEAAAVEPAPEEEKPQVAAEQAPEAASVETGFGWHSLPLVPIMLGVAVVAMLGFLVVLRSRRREEALEMVAAADSHRGVVSLKDAKTLRESQVEALDDLMAAGSWPEARSLAQELVDSDPSDAGIKVRLLNIMHAQGDSTAFNSLAGKLAASGFAADHPEAWAEVADRGRDLVPENALFTTPEPESKDVLAEGELDDVLASLESELDSLDEEPAEERPSAAADLIDESETLEAIEALEEDKLEVPVAESRAGDEETLEFDVDLSLDEGVEETPAKPAADEDVLDFDLGDWALDEDEVPPPAPEKAEENEPDIDLGLDLGIGAESPVAEKEREIDNIVNLHGAMEEPDIAEAASEPAATEASSVVVEEEEVETKLDLARAFLDLGDAEGARSILEEVVTEGNERQRQEAETLLRNVG